MKVFGILALVVLATVSTAIKVPLRQSCIDLKKALESAAKGPGDCSKLTQSLEASELEGEVEIPDQITSLPSVGEIAGRFQRVRAIYNCFMEANQVRDADNNTVIAKLKTAISTVAQSPEKAQELSSAIDACNFGNAATIAPSQRLGTVICVLSNVYMKGTCNVLPTEASK